MYVLYDIRDWGSPLAPRARRIDHHAASGRNATGMESDVRRPALVAVNFNTDVRDAWEYADAPCYPEAMTTLAYRYGINYLIYSMTHNLCGPRAFSASLRAILRA